MNAGPMVSVRGQAILEVDPEIAVLSLTAQAQSNSRTDAVAVLSGRVAAIGAVLDAHAAAIEKRETSGLQVYPEFDPKSGKPRRYHGRCTTSVTVTDFAALSDLVVEASAIELADVSGPWWQLRPTSDVYRQARLAAVTDAVRRAHEYAAAFGVNVESLIEVADQGMSVSNPVMHKGDRMAMRSVAFAGEAADVSIDLEPARQQVTGQIEARFTMGQPDLNSLPR